MKKNLKKYDKLIIVLVFCFALVILSWFIKGGTYRSGVFSNLGYFRAGIYDFLFNLYGTIYYKLPDLFYIIMVGGCYGVLSETKSYRKLVDKSIELIHGREKIAMALLVLLTGIYVSITTQIFVIFALVPFIVTVFLGDGKDRLVALCASFGGTFLGVMAQTFGTYGMSYLNQSLLLTYKEYFALKAVIFVLLYILFMVFTIVYMNQHKKTVDEIDYDLFATEELDETEAKKKTKLWPTLIVMGVALIIGILAYISWDAGFGIKAFSELFTKFNTKFSVKEVPVLATLLGTNNGNLSAFGSINDLLFESILFLIVAVVVAIINKVSVADFFKNFGNGSKRLFGVGLIYCLCFMPILLASQFPWAITVVNSVFGSGKFNVLSILTSGFLGQILLVDQDFIGYVFGAFLATTYADKVAITSIIWRFGYGLALLVGPTSFLLMSILTYLDIPYKKWLGFIWKFACAAIIVFILTICVVVYL